MITEVIKRDGRREPFTVEKINKWWMWSTQQHGIPLGEGSEAVQRAVNILPSVCTTEQLQRALISELVALKTWNTVKMAGALEASITQKKVFPNGIPSVREQFENLARKGIMISFDFDDQEWEQINNLIDHSLDFKMPQFSIVYIMKSYSLGDITKGIYYETPQFVYMRMACAVASGYSKAIRMEVLSEQYFLMSIKVLSAPTPNFTHLGTPNNGLASCCLYTASDDRKSLAAAEHVTYVMTYSSAGLGYHHSVRSIGDPVRGGLISHQGEQWYLRSNAASAAANRQSKRGGAITAYISGYSKEADEILAAREPNAPVSSALIGIDIALTMNKDFLTRAYNKKMAAHFTSFDNPELYKCLYSADNKKFEALMEELVSKTTDESKLFSPRKILGTLGRVTNSTGRNYAFFSDNANKHTPFLEPIHSSNLCTEIMEVTKPYESTVDLYREDDDVTGEVALCNLAAINHALVADDPDLHKRACKAALRMIDYCVHNGYYELKHIGYTAKKRINAGVGVMNTATYMAKNKLSYSSKEGLESMHDFAERQMYFLIEASLELGKDLGNAPWIHKTKWAGYTDKDGNKISAWMPIDTQTKRVAKEFDIKPKMDWEDLRSRVAENGGIRNSVLFALMPGESSSKALGGSNCIYPVRDLGLDKTDNTTNIDWVAEGAGSPDFQYQFAHTLSVEDTVKFYAVWQMWIDQGISADFWPNYEKGTAVLETDDILKKYIMMHSYGMKAHYYTVHKTQKSKDERKKEQDDMINRAQKIVAQEQTAAEAFSDEFESDGPVCTSGGCSI